MVALSLIFGILVGVSLGLTGGGGSIFAVPLLVYGLSVNPRIAVGVSLAAVGATAFVGTLERLRAKQVEIRTGLIFAFAGMLGAPIGSWLAGQISETLLLILFAGLMLLVAARMWRKSTPPENMSGDTPDEDQPTCRRDPGGRLLMTSRCALLLSFVGVLAGVFAGLFGVGGGFVIVPALIMFSGMGIHRAVATSLLVISLISVSGVASHLMAGRSIPLDITMLFVAGGIVGLFLGNRIGRHVSGLMLRRVFAVAILGVACFVIYSTLTQTA